tara:strand:+ start:207 stop:362 length:156 start_codon:yes stop_codon:yes gene_type:complete
MKSCTKSDTINKLIDNIESIKSDIYIKENSLAESKIELYKKEQDLEYELNN